MPGEFQVIREHFQREVRDDALLLGIGDDGAVLRPRAGFDQVVVTDTLVHGRHFPAGFASADIGWRALAVNLSDIAAMGASPRFVFLNLTLPRDDADWLRGFARGFFEMAALSGTTLAGGDTTQGPLTVSVTVIGELPPGSAITRAGASPGDLVCVSGTPGDAAAGLALLERNEDAARPLVARFRRPTPRLALGETLRGVASAAIDISDGLLADLGHILSASGVGARIALDALPVSSALAACMPDAREFVLAGGDDYELCFCLPRERLDAVRDKADCTISVIGEITAERDLRVVTASGEPFAPTRRGYEHFAGDAGS